ncbi:MAG: hypothetical protein VX252_13150 [Myxococcota bacterium]|nr:hypothetical protein [Myxococcota bacterium]
MTRRGQAERAIGQAEEPFFAQAESRSSWTSADIPGTKWLAAAFVFRREMDGSVQSEIPHVCSYCILFA